MGSFSKNIRLLALLPFISKAAILPVYDIKDLEILEKENNYQEYLQHALDIRPGLRNNYWREMTKNMATGHIDDLIKRKVISWKSYEFIKKISTWPALRNDEFFQIKKGKYFEIAFENCVKKENHSKCTSELSAFWELSPKDPDQGIRFANIIDKNKIDYQLWPLLSPAAKSEISPFICNKDLFQREFLKRVIPSLGKKNNDKEVRSIINSDMNEKCWSSLSLTLKQILSGPSELKSNYAFELLNVMEGLDQNETDIYLTSFILNGPIIGDTFNLAWKTIEALGQNYKRRMQVLKQLQRQQVLPGRIFAAANTERRKVLLNFLNKNFPEYIDHYVETCTNYYEGRGIFPKGNPTMECKELISISNASDYISSDSLNSLKSIIK